jgi:hypothetical protein
MGIKVIRTISMIGQFDGQEFVRKRSAMAYSLKFSALRDSLRSIQKIERLKIVAMHGLY